MKRINKLTHNNGAVSSNTFFAACTITSHSTLCNLSSNVSMFSPASSLPPSRPRALPVHFFDHSVYHHARMCNSTSLKCVVRAFNCIRTVERTGQGRMKVDHGNRFPRHPLSRSSRDLAPLTRSRKPSPNTCIHPARTTRSGFAFKTILATSTS